MTRDIESIGPATLVVDEIKISDEEVEAFAMRVHGANFRDKRRVKEFGGRLADADYLVGVDAFIRTLKTWQAEAPEGCETLIEFEREHDIDVCNAYINILYRREETDAERDERVADCLDYSRRRLEHDLRRDLDTFRSLSAKFERRSQTVADPSHSATDDTKG